MERKRTVVGSGIVCATERQAIPIMEKNVYRVTKQSWYDIIQTQSQLE